MDKAKFIDIRMGKKGQFVGSLDFGDNKIMPIPPGYCIDESLNGKECSVERVKGMINKIIVDGKEIERKTVGNRKGVNKKTGISNRGPNNNNKRKIKDATAPYNFIPLNESIVKSELNEDEIHTGSYNTDEKGRKRVTGYIDIYIKTISPLYIRGTNAADKEKFSDFFAPGGIPRIPGSSLRGMIRTMVEIVSWSKIGFVDKDKRLYFRAVADNQSLAKHYRSKIVGLDDNQQSKLKAGFINRRSNGTYYITPSDYTGGTQIYRVDIEKVKKAKINIGHYDSKEVYYKPPLPISNKRMRSNTDVFRYPEVQDIRKTQIAGYERGFVISSGPFPRKQKHWIINKPNPKVIKELDYEVVNSYKSDSSRKANIDLLAVLDDRKKKLEKYPEGIPCFYIENNNRVVAFGHTGMFRLPYEKTIGDHIPPHHNNEEMLDIAEAMFGKKSENDKGFATRLFFEDAKLTSSPEDAVMEEVVPNILASPKPTCYQHYLETDNGNACHWDQDTFIRGNKVYWHRWSEANSDDYIAEELSVPEKYFKENDSQISESSDFNYIETDGDKIRIKSQYSKITDPKIKDAVKKYILTDSTSQYTLIKPIKPGMNFKGRIRFENLTEVELGALLFVLSLPENLYHRIGMGKPIGLGTVKITPKLFILDRVKRYKKLFHKNEWELSQTPENIDMYIDIFSKFVGEKIGEENCHNASSLWETKRLRQLKMMLDYSNVGNNAWLARREYMKLGEFNPLKVLPYPEDVDKT